MTDERFPNGSLDRWLREHAENADEHPAPDGWDRPSERVWTGVSAGLQRRKRRRERMIVWWFAGLAVAVGAGLLAWHWTDEGPVAAAAQTSIVVTQPALSESGEQQPVDASGRNEPVMNERFGPAHSSPLPPFKGRKLRAWHPGLDRETMPQSPPLKGGRGDEPVSPYHLEIDTTQFFSEKNQPAAIDPSLIFYQKNARTITPALAPLAARISPPLQPVQRQITLSPTEWKKTRRSNDLRIGVASGFFFTTRSLRASQSVRPNGVEHGAWTWQTGLSVGRSIARHWSLETGVQWTTVHLQAERQGIIRFRTNQERYDPSRDTYDSSERQQVQTSFGEVGLRFDLSRRAGQVIHDQEVIRLTMQTDERVRYLRLPLALLYSASHGRWQWGAQAGLGLSLRTAYSLDVTAARADRAGIVAVRAAADRRATGLASALADAQFGLELGYRLTPHWSLRLAPEFRRGFTSLYRQGPFAAYPVSAGIQAGLTLKI